MDTDFRSPGYYPDPENPGMERWWNGQGWSDSRRPTGGAAEQTSAPAPMPPTQSATPPPPPPSLLPPPTTSEGAAWASDDAERQWETAAKSFLDAVEGPNAPKSEIGKFAAAARAVNVPALLRNPTPAPGATVARWAWKPAIVTFSLFLGLFVVSVLIMIVIAALNPGPSGGGSVSTTGTAAGVFILAFLVAFCSFWAALPGAIIAGFVGGKKRHRSV